MDVQRHFHAHVGKLYGHPPRITVFQTLFEHTEDYDDDNDEQRQLLIFVYFDLFDEWDGNWVRLQGKAKTLLEK